MPNSPIEFQIFAKNLQGKTITCDVKPTTTIEELKRIVETKEGWFGFQSKIALISAP
jgi:hypothetical protein